MKTAHRASVQIAGFKTKAVLKIAATVPCEFSCHRLVSTGLLMN